jgi:hypothetical protein
VLGVDWRFSSDDSWNKKLQIPNTSMSNADKRGDDEVGVMDYDSPPPPPHPIDDILLMDMDWAGLTAKFPAARVHADVRAGETSLFVMNDALRTLALLPVKRGVGPHITTTEKWVPFLVDTGAAATQFTQASVDALGLEPFDRILVKNEPISFHASTKHFLDINVLGTDVLKCARVVIDYPMKAVDIPRTLITVPIAPAIWVRVGRYDMKVTPSGNDIFTLKKAVNVELESWGERPIHAGKMRVKTHDGTACREDHALEATTLDTAYIVTK